MNEGDSLESLSPLESVYWSDLKGNQYGVDIQPGMLLEGGIQVKKLTIKKTDYNGTPAYYMLATYDRNFVIAKLAKVLKPIRSIPWNELMKLISEAVKHG